MIRDYEGAMRMISNGRNLDVAARQPNLKGVRRVRGRSRERALPSWGAGSLPASWAAA